VDTLILGCTHYPMLSGLIQYVMGEDVVLVSSAEETAKDVYAVLREGSLLREEAGEPAHGFLTTGDPERFRRIAHHFLGPEIGGIGAVAVAATQGVPWS
jgi:glutamate racemase